MSKLTKDEQAELEYLRYFYDEVESALGPASDEIYRNIAEQYGKDLPKGYASWDEDEST